MPHDIVHECALRLGIPFERIFLRAAQCQGFTNPEEIARNRLALWMKGDVLPPYVEQYCRQAMNAHAQHHWVTGQALRANGGIYSAA